MDISKIAILVAEGIFSDKKTFEIEDKKYTVNILLKSGLRYVDLGGFRFIEQNPDKSSKWAQMAREGKQIIWVFKGGTYYARVVEGKFTLLGKE